MLFDVHTYMTHPLDWIPMGCQSRADKGLSFYGPHLLTAEHTPICAQRWRRGMRFMQGSKLTSSYRAE